MVRVNRLTNCSSYWLTLTPAISVKHFSVTLRNMGTFKNWNTHINNQSIYRTRRISTATHFTITSPVNSQILSPHRCSETNTDSVSHTRLRLQITFIFSLKWINVLKTGRNKQLSQSSSWQMSFSQTSKIFCLQPQQCYIFGADKIIHRTVVWFGGPKSWFLLSLHN